MLNPISASAAVAADVEQPLWCAMLVLDAFLLPSEQLLNFKAFFSPLSATHLFIFFVSFFRYEKPNLEDVFLELCLQDGDVETASVREKREERPTIYKKANNNSSQTKAEPLLSNSKSKVLSKKNSEKISFTNGGSKVEVQTQPHQQSQERRVLGLSTSKVNACMLKTFNRMKKRIGFLIYQFVLPAIQVSLFCMAIGQDPKELPVAVVNGELPGATECSECKSNILVYICTL